MSEETQGFDALDEAVADLKDASVPRGHGPLERGVYYRALGRLEGIAGGLRLLYEDKEDGR